MADSQPAIHLENVELFFIGILELSLVKLCELLYLI